MRKLSVNQCIITVTYILFLWLPVAAQQPVAYRASASKLHDLVHTVLDVRLDYAKQFLYGKATITLQPHAYPMDSLQLDAKGMDIKEVALLAAGKRTLLQYSYDSLQLHIKLNKLYQPGEKYQVYIAYTARPNLFKSEGSAAISSAKGLYFINPDSAIAGKPVQVWTQGETEANSVWFPTIDKPNQKTTTQISITAPAKYVTLSNGYLTAQHNNGDGTRTDTWKMDQPYAPYLVMMAVGNFYIHKEKWKGKEVSYYVEPAQAPFVKQLFGHTPEMMSFYSRLLGVDYPWNKYAQVVVRDFVSGAMENTTATVHGDFTYQNNRQLLDENIWEGNIAHELFHHWFGDYVTTESWSNLTVNESFANYSETLWSEYKYGVDGGDYTNYNAAQIYLTYSPEDEHKNLVRFDYEHAEDLMDRVTYQKGGRILHMLRNYLGKEVFNKGMHIYLTQNAYKTGEAQQVRLAMEEASGKDLNWFFDQWYYGSGHPYLDIKYAWNEATKTQAVYIQQTQADRTFTLPFAIDVYVNGKAQRHNVWMKTKADTFRFTLPSKPDLVNVDADKILLAKKTDHKSLQEYVYQYFHAPLFLDRLEAIQQAAGAQQDAAARNMLVAACKDKFFRLRTAAMDSLNMQLPEVRTAALPVLLALARNDSSTLAQAAALNAIGRTKDSAYLALYKEKISSPSYSVQAAALNGIAAIDMPGALQYAGQLEKDSKDLLSWAIAAIYGRSGDTSKLAFFRKQLDGMFINRKSRMIAGYLLLLSQTNNADLFKTHFDNALTHIRDYKQYKAQGRFLPLLQMVHDKKEAAHLTVQAAQVDAAVKEMSN